MFARGGAGIVVEGEKRWFRSQTEKLGRASDVGWCGWDPASRATVNRDKQENGG